jgi:Arc/MetJ-type ribon-helix-helix transcriptional regulator
MSKSRAVLPKPNRGGRPASGRDPARTIRLSDEFLTKVDSWAGKQEDKPSRSEAIRRLVELGLKVKTPARTVSKPGRRLRARELATKAIEKIIDPAAPTDERDRRRRHLTKGPLEFREDRVDLPKAKK